jgi:hypothetical protein
MKEHPILIVMNHSPFPENANGVNKIICNYIKFSKRKFIIFQIKGEIVKFDPELDVVVHKFETNMPFRKGFQLDKELSEIKKKYSTDSVLFVSLGVMRLFSNKSTRGSTLFLIDNPIIYYLRKIRESNSIIALYCVLRLVELCMVYKNIKGKVAFVAELDTKVFSLVSNSIVKTVPNGIAPVDASLFVDAVHPKIIFHGNFSYEPNRLAAEKFLRIAALGEFSKYDFVLFGNGTQDLVAKSQNVAILTYVENLHHLMNVGDVYFSPLSIGSGVQNKILEAFQYGLYVIGSPTSFAGIDCLGQLNNRGFCSINVNEISKIEGVLTEYFNDSVAVHDSLLENQKFMQERFSWSESVKIMEEFLDGAAV